MGLTGLCYDSSNQNNVSVSFNALVNISQYDNNQISGKRLIMQVSYREPLWCLHDFLDMDVYEQFQNPMSKENVAAYNFEEIGGVH